MAVTVNNLKEYLRLPPDSVENLRIYFNAAKTKARTAGIPDYKKNAQYDLFIMALAAMYYENRSMTGVDEKAQLMINSFVLELRHSGEDK